MCADNHFLYVLFSNATNEMRHRQVFAFTAYLGTLGFIFASKIPRQEPLQAWDYQNVAFNLLFSALTAHLVFIFTHKIPRQVPRLGLSKFCF